MMRSTEIPTYSFRNRETGEEFEKFLKISEREEFLEQNPNLEQTLKCAPGVSYNDAKKPDEGFRDILRNIKKHHPRGDVNTF